MGSPPPPQSLSSGTRRGTRERGADDAALRRLHNLGPGGRRTFAGAFGAYALNSYDYFTLPLSVLALAAYFGLDSGRTGLYITVTPVVSATGGAVAGVSADRAGRVRALMITVATYAVFAVACGFAPDYETLLVFRALQRLGLGGEWAVGAILVAEYASAGHRGRTLGAIQSSRAVGRALAAIVCTLLFSLVGDYLAWRVMFWTGALPALLVLWLRRRVHDAPEATAAPEQSAERGPFAAVFRPGAAESPGLLCITITVFASLLSTGVQGGYCTPATWVPTYLRTERGLSVVGIGGCPPEHLAAAIRESSLFPAVHGSPVRCGDPSAPGIDDLGRPDFGDPVDAGPDDIPVFWACGVTPQAAVTASRPPFAITHAPGRTFLTDARDEQYRVA